MVIGQPPEMPSNKLSAPSASRPGLVLSFLKTKIDCPALVIADKLPFLMVCLWRTKAGKLKPARVFSKCTVEVEKIKAGILSPL